MSTIEKYILLIKKFVTVEIEAPEFEALYLDMFKNDSDMRSEKDFEVLNALFIDVDEFCSDSDLRDEDDLNEQDLLKRAEDALKELT